MTAEITVMNSSGVALAADSAVTVGAGSIIYNSANKLFPISKFHQHYFEFEKNRHFFEKP